MSFGQLGLIPELLRAVESLGYQKATPIQAAAIPPALAKSDILGCAQTGTGKTASFTLPILQHLQNGRRGTLRALILAPTRELAEQISANVTAYGRNLKLRCGIVIGGDNIRRQERMLEAGLDIVVATPGRLLDHVQRGSVSLKNIEILVLDEADRMLDMGFIHDIRRIVAELPKQRQTMMFSATLPGPIVKLAGAILNKPQRVQVAPPSSTPLKVTQVVHPVKADHKKNLLLHLLASPTMEQVIVFTRTKWGANKLTTYLQSYGHHVAAIHGNKTQAQRRSALQRFKSGKLRVLVATDIAARGIDVPEVSHVVNFEVPATPEDYVHRIGRTGRAEASGVAVSLMSDAERPMIRAIERLVGMSLPKEILHAPIPPPVEMLPETTDDNPRDGAHGRSTHRRDARNSRPQGYDNAAAPRSRHANHVAPRDVRVNEKPARGAWQNGVADQPHPRASEEKTGAPPRWRSVAARRSRVQAR